MTLFRLVLHDLQHRPRSFAAAALAVAIGCGGLVVSLCLLHAHELETGRILLSKKHRVTDLSRHVHRQVRAALSPPGADLATPPGGEAGDGTARGTGVRAAAGEELAALAAEAAHRHEAERQWRRFFRAVVPVWVVLCAAIVAYVMAGEVHDRSKARAELRTAGCGAGPIVMMEAARMLLIGAAGGLAGYAVGGWIAAGVVWVGGVTDEAMSWDISLLVECLAAALAMGTMVGGLALASAMASGGRVCGQVRTHRGEVAAAAGVVAVLAAVLLATVVFLGVRERSAAGMVAAKSLETGHRMARLEALAGAEAEAGERVREYARALLRVERLVAAQLQSERARLANGLVAAVLAGGVGAMGCAASNRARQRPGAFRWMGRGGG